MPEQTPGPWFQLSGTHNQRVIANTVGANWSNPAHFVGTVTSHNAALVAAAPDLFDELSHTAEWVHGMIDDMDCDAGNPDGGSAANCEHCQLIRSLNHIDAILAKARGEGIDDVEM